MTRDLDRLLVGAVDLHYHSAPSPFPRRLDPAAAARQYEAAGFRAVVLKSHHHNTVMDILTLDSTVLADLQLRVYGGIALNGTVGGLNPRAVELCLKMGGKIVWFPTMSSEAHIRYHQEHHETGFPTSQIDLIPEAPIDVLGPDGDLKPEVYQIFDIIRDTGAILASGHLPPDRIRVLFQAARDRGVTRLLCNHPNFVIGLDYAGARELIDLGAVIEHSAGFYNDQAPRPSHTIEDLRAWIDAVGVEHTSLGSDVGQRQNPGPVETFRRVSELLLEHGTSERDVRRMIADTPARLLGMEGD